MRFSDEYFSPPILRPCLYRFGASKAQEERFSSLPSSIEESTDRYSYCTAARVWFSHPCTHCCSCRRYYWHSECPIAQSGVWFLSKSLPGLFVSYNWKRFSAID